LHLLAGPGDCGLGFEQLLLGVLEFGLHLVVEAVGAVSCPRVAASSR
jgi:hypothetical protein